MRRVFASIVLMTGTFLVAGCGLMDAGSDEPGPLRTLTTKGFRIQLPCTPVEDTTTQSLAPGVRVTLRSWTCEYDELAYVVSTTKVPGDSPLDLDGVAPGGANAVGGTVGKEKKVRFAGLPGRDFTITATHKGRPATIFSRALLRGRSLIQVQVALVGGEATKAPATYRTILKSLAIR